MALTASRQIQNDAYTVGWVCARSKEMAAALAMLDERHEGFPTRGPLDDNNYELGSISGHNIVIACLPHGSIGTTSAATVAMKMIGTFRSVRVGLMVGIGGGVSRKVRLGDVVVGSPDDCFPGVVQWDMGKAVSGGKFTRTGSLNKTPTSLRTTISKLQAHHDEGAESKVPQYLKAMLEHPGRGKFARPEQTRDVLFKPLNPHKDAPDDPAEDDTEEEVDSDDVDRDECRYCDKSQIVKRKQRPEGRLMKIHYGVIASGNQVVKDPVVRDGIYNALNQKVLCVEMEAAGLVDNFPCIVIRGICDYADSHKNDAWQGHAAAVAAAYAKELLTYLPPNQVEGEKPANEVLQVLQEVQGGVSDLKSANIKLENAKVSDWLSESDFGEKQSECLGKRQAGTGKWFLDSAEYRNWLTTSSQVLLCSGMPGAGKTIITSTVIEHLESQSFGSDVAICYAYCDFNRKNDQTIEGLMLGLLKQLAQCKRPLPEAVEALYKLHESKKTRPQLSEIIETFQKVVADFARVFLIIDALDEYHTENNSQIDFVERLLTLKEEAGLSLFATSRPVAHITNRFSGHHLHATMDGNGDDITHYLQESIPRVLSFKVEDDPLMDEVAVKISQASKGMFLLATLQLQSLEGIFRPKDIRAELAKISGSSDSSDVLYDKVYNATMKRICNRGNYRKKWALQTLGWLTYNEKPLSMVELQHALDMEYGKTTIGPDGDMFSAEYLSCICAGLVTVDERSGIIRLVHYTTQKYLLSSTKRWFPKIQSTMATSCVTYLSLHHGCHSWNDVQRYYPFYGYAARYWIAHTRKVSTSKGAVAYRAVTSFLKQGSHWTPTRRGYDPFTGTRTTGLHLAVILGLRKIICGLIDQFDINEIDANLMSPLAWTIRMERSDLARFLIQRGALIGYTSIREAIAKKDANWLKFLSEHEAAHQYRLSDTKVNIEDVHSAEVLEFIIRDCGMKINGYGYGWTALQDVACRGLVWVARILLKYGANVDEQDKNLKITALHRASGWEGNEEMIEFLIQRGANVNAADHNGNTPLILALKKGSSTGVLQLLLEAGANVNASNREGETPLLTAMRRPGGIESSTAILEIMKMLLEKDADPNVANKKGQTPLLTALRRGFGKEAALRFSELLLEKGADVNAAQSNGETLRSIAERLKMPEVVKLLASYQEKRKGQ